MPKATNRSATKGRGKARRDADLRQYIAKLYGNELDKANAEIHRLVVLLSGRPHDKGCRYVLGRGDRKCSCWKREIRHET
jgi:hypothetical protein